MSYTIILDSSNTKLTVGLALENSLVDSTSYEAWQAQSEHMIPEINNLLLKHKVDREQITSIIVAVGPGSYTGVRISITIAKVMALALKCKVIPVSSLHALKNSNQKSICLINARSGRSYVGVYEGNNVLIKDTIWKNDEVLEYIKSNPDTCVCGNTTYLKLEGFESNIAEELLSLKESYPEVSQVETLKPIYMKD